MDDARQKKFDSLEGDVRSCLREYLVLRKVLIATDAASVRNTWLSRVECAIHDCLDVLLDVQDEVLHADQRQRRAHEAGRAKKRQVAVADRGRPLTDDADSIPGAIRRVLAQHPEGLTRSELFRAVVAVRPKTKREEELASAIFAMVKRRELLREGSHKQYRYRLTPREAEPGAVEVEGAEAESAAFDTSSETKDTHV